MKKQIETPVETGLGAEQARLEEERARRRAQLATLETETGAIDAELVAVDAEREPLALRANDDAAADAALEALEERAVRAAGRHRKVTTKSDALRKEIAALDARLSRVAFDLRVEATREMRHHMETGARAVDAAMQVLKKALREHLALCADLQVEGEALGFKGWSRLGETLRPRLYVLMQLTEVLPNLTEDPVFEVTFRSKTLAALEESLQVPENPQPPDRPAVVVPMSLKPKKKEAA